MQFQSNDEKCQVRPKGGTALKNMLFDCGFCIKYGKRTENHVLHFSMIVVYPDQDIQDQFCSLLPLFWVIAIYFAVRDCTNPL